MQVGPHGLPMPMQQHLPLQMESVAMSPQLQPMPTSHASPMMTAPSSVPSSQLSQQQLQPLVPMQPMSSAMSPPQMQAQMPSSPGPQGMVVEVVCPFCHAVGPAPLDVVCVCSRCGQQLVSGLQAQSNMMFLVGGAPSTPPPQPPKKVQHSAGHPSPERTRAQERMWKTKMCMAGENCKFGNRCWFAHSIEELHGNRGALPRNWKTSMCRSGRSCKFGEHCWFAHSEAELRKPADAMPDISVSLASVPMPPPPLSNSDGTCTTCTG